MNRLLAEGVGYTLIDAAQQAIGLVSIPVILLYLGPAEFGEVTWGLVWMQLALAVGVLGLDFALLRQSAVLPADVRPSVNVRVLTMALAVCAVAAGLGWLMATSLPARFGGGPAVQIGGAIGLLLAVRGVPLAVLRAQSDVPRYATVMIGGAVLQAIGQVGGAVALPNAAGYLAGYAIAAGAGLLWALAVTRRQFAWAQFGRWPDGPLVRYALAIVPSVFFNRVVAAADRVAVFQGQDLATLGNYGLASRLSMPVKMLSGGFKTALAPAFNRMEADGASPTPVLLQFGSFVTRLVVWASAMLLVAIELLAFTPWGVTSSLQVGTLLAILLVAQAGSSLAALLQTAVYYSARPGRASVAGGLSTCVLLVSLALLVPRHGAVGAAWAQVLAAWSGLALQAYWLASARGLVPHVLAWVAASLVPLVVAWASVLLVPNLRISSKLLFAILTGVTLLPDVRQLRGFLRPTTT